jgi:hypothetical protein
MYQDFRDLLSLFHAHSVKYLIVGGYAVSYYSQPRATKDMDLFIKADSANATAAYEALVAFGAPLQEIGIEDLANPRYFVRFEGEPLAIDIMPGIDGVDFDAAWESRAEGTLDAQAGITGFCISKDDLIADVEAIREAGASQVRQSADKTSPETKPDGSGQ